MLTWQWRLLICWTSDTCLFSLLDLSFIATFSAIQLRGSTLQPCPWLFMLKRLHKKRMSLLLYGQREGGTERLVRYSGECNPLQHSTKYLFIYLPSWCHSGLQNPWRGKCIKPLTVFTCVGLMLMCEGRPEDGGWEIDHRWMSVGGILTSTTAFHTLSSMNLSSGDVMPSENNCLTHRLRHCRLFHLTVQNNGLTLP